MTPTAAAAAGLPELARRLTPYDLSARLARVLPRVEKPGRYAGGEWGCLRKHWDTGAPLDPGLPRPRRTRPVRWALVFPDVYEVGMSYLGFRILYQILSERDDALCERAHSPWVDMEREMRAEGIPLYGLESRHPLAQFDVVAFTLSYELTYTNVVNALDLAGIPLLARDRDAADPVVIAGGVGALNPEPLAELFDACLLGEGEEAVADITDAVRGLRVEGQPPPRRELWRRLARVEGIYAPGLYESHHAADGSLRHTVAVDAAAPTTVRRRSIDDLDRFPYPTRQVVPFVEIVHDRVTVEVMRGCTKGCRFCQAGYVTRPVRERRAEVVEEMVAALLAQTGYSEVSLMSLSSGDYTQVARVATAINDRFGADHTSVSLSSLRVDSFDVGLARVLSPVRRSGITLAPEAGTQRMRDSINKDITEPQLWAAVRDAFASGWSTIKLYFMIGLPNETDDDVRGIAEVVGGVLEIGREAGTSRRPAQVNLTVSTFVPKPHAAYQWSPIATREEVARKQRILLDALPRRGCRASFGSWEETYLEAVLSMGDRRLLPVILEAWRRGARFDAWQEQLRPAIWAEAFAATGVDGARYACRERPPGEAFPWEHLSAAVQKGFLRNEFRLARAGLATGDCKTTPCTDCGACAELDVDVLVPAAAGAPLAPLPVHVNRG